MGVQNPEIRVSLSHLRDLPLYKEEVPYEIWFEQLDPTIKKTNIQLEITKNVPVTDVRSLGSQAPRLETHGFEYFHQALPDYCGIRTVDDVGDQNEVQRKSISQYLECMTQLLQERYKGRNVICYDWRVCAWREPFDKSIECFQFLTKSVLRSVVPKRVFNRRHQISIT